MVTAARGRGALSNPAGRYEKQRVVPIADIEDDDAPASPRTTVTPEQARRIISTNDSPDIPFDQSINPYRGCEHGCVYCFARPTHAYLGLSPGLDFETRLFSKPDAPRLLEQELRHPAYRWRTIALGANTDPYQPIEKRLGITRALLEVLAAHRHPVSIVTKSDLVLRDVDLIAGLARDRLACVMLSVTTLDRGLARRMEPRAPVPGRRLQAMRELSAAAGSAGYVLLRLPLEIKDLFREWLETREPLKAPRILGLVRDTRGGALYDSTYGVRMRGVGPHAELLRRRFEVACRRLSLRHRPLPLETGLFRVPPRAGDQMALFT